MTLKKILKALTAGLMIGYFIAGSALAQDASLSDTGPESDNSISIDKDNDITINNENDVDIDNKVDQDARSGDAEVVGNTSAGDARSGEALNVSTIDTAIEINNKNKARFAEVNEVSGVGGPGAGGAAGAGAGGPGVGGAAPGVGVGAGPRAGGGMPGVGGGVGGEAGLGAGLLPEAGPDFPIDVSALRDAYNPNDGSKALERTRGLSTGLLALASLLSLAGAAGSAVFARRRAGE